MRNLISIQLLLPFLLLLSSLSSCKRERVTQKEIDEWEEQNIVKVEQSKGVTPKEPLSKDLMKESEGMTIKIQGVVKFPTYKTGPIQVDAFDRPQRAGGQKEMPRIVTFTRIDKPGEFILEIPTGYKDLWLSAYNDIDDDGKPSHGDPIGYYKNNPVKVSSEGGSMIEIIIPEQATRPEK